MSCSTSLLSSFRGASNPLKLLASGQTLVFDLEGALLRSSSTFPYFMLVALESTAGLLRGLLLLLLLYPLGSLLSHEAWLRVMVMVCFCGLRKESFRAGRAVLPKFFMEDVGLEGFEMLRIGGRRVCVVSRMPRVMVEEFLKEYMEVEAVVGRELKVAAGFYTGLMDGKEEKRVKEYFGEGTKDSGFVGVTSSAKDLQHPFSSICKETYLVSEVDKSKWRPLPRERYPKPLVFHDGRIAFRPDPLHTILMVMWLPIAIPLAILRLTAGVLLPYKLSTLLLAATGARWKFAGPVPPPHIRSNSPSTSTKRHLYVCNHRTLIDPVYVSIALDKPVAAVVYSVSRLSELISPIRTVRLTRNREDDRRTLEALLAKGDLIISPEGTTCREPYLLRFSPLFTELADELVPVALNVQVSMFYATTAGGLKCLDPIYYMMNPWMCYEIQFLEKMDTRKVRDGEVSSIEMANRVQEKIGRALGFECTRLTRRDKYRKLAGNDGIVGEMCGEMIGCN